MSLSLATTNTVVDTDLDEFDGPLPVSKLEVFLSEIIKIEVLFSFLRVMEFLRGILKNWKKQDSILLNL